jgi:murein DD-endopeptidase MepM/ murein hydrolase activator NlpD
MAAFMTIALTAIGTGLASSALAASSARAARPVAVEYHLPFPAGQSFPVTQTWGGSYSHEGLAAYAYDFGLPSGTPVLAAAPGVVAFAVDGFTACGDASLRQAANYVTIYHADGTATLYAHLSKVSVRVGQVVAGGEEIGRSGKTGFTGCQPHLHFAREPQGRHGVTQSIRVYFAETGRRRLRTGARATSANSSCSTTSGGVPDEAFCAVYMSATVVGDLPTARLEHQVGIDPSGRVGSLQPKTASWIGRFAFASGGTYLFSATSGGAVRISIDGTPVIDSAPPPATAVDPERAADGLVKAGLEAPAPPGTGASSMVTWIAAGWHVIRVDYVAGPTPGLQVDWRATGSDPLVRKHS